MPRTHAFRSGNGHAVQIPSELAYGDLGTELTITRHGDVLTIFPTRSGPRDSVARLRLLPRPDASKAREPIEMPHRADDPPS